MSIRKFLKDIDSNLDNNYSMVNIIEETKKQHMDVLESIQKDNLRKVCDLVDVVHNYILKNDKLSKEDRKKAQLEIRTIFYANIIVPTLEEDASSMRNIQITSYASSKLLPDEFLKDYKKSA